MKKLFVVVCCLVILTPCALFSQALSYASGDLAGEKLATHTTLGSGGMVNTIEVVITAGGINWSVVCRRSNSNLGLCTAVASCSYVRSTGVFSSNSILEPTTFTCQ